MQYRYVVAANQSGKSATPAREIAWVLNQDHPTWTRPGSNMCPCCRSTDIRLVDREKRDYACPEGHEWRDWGSGPLKIIVAGQDRKMMELELWGSKLLPFLRKEEWREVRSGQALSHVENRITGDVIIFIPHADSSEQNRKHMQSYVGHYVWLDEMPTSIKVFEELQRRVDSNRGYFVATFTPKFRNIQIKKQVDSSRPPLGKKYQMSKFDNPLFRGQEEIEKKKLLGHTESYIRCVLYGDWMADDGAIYEFIPETHGGIPEGYNPSWRHVVVADPATESKLGLSIWAECPTPLGVSDEVPQGRRTWWCVRAEYIEGIYTPTKIIEEVEKRIAGINILQRRVDSAATWFTRQAADMPVGAACPSQTWLGVEHKNDVGAKDGFIRKFQQALGVDIRVADWCLDYIEEMQTYERSPETGRIIAASKFHLIDCGHYFVASIPPAVHTYVYESYESRLYHAYLLEEKRRLELARQRAGSQRRMHVLPGGKPDVEPPLPPMPRPGRRSGWRRTYKLG